MTHTSGRVLKVGLALAAYYSGGPWQDTNHY
jgi:hypothetical protein